MPLWLHIATDWTLLTVIVAGAWIVGRIEMEKHEDSRKNANGNRNGSGGDANGSAPDVRPMLPFPERND